MIDKKPYSLFSNAIKICLATALAFIFALNSGFSQTIVEIGGEIQSQEWTNDFVYHVTSHLIINTGVELVIRPGVKVKFRQGTGMTVNGSIKVYGEDNGVVDTVYFQPLYIDPPFSWKWIGIQINRVQAPNQNFIDHARIENAFTGISISGDARHVTVTNSVVHNSLLFGIVINSSNEIIIDNCRIQHNTGAGINIQNSNDCVIANNYISDNNDGVWLLASETANQSTGNTISGNVIRNNTYTSIFVNNVDGGKCSGNLIENNFIEKSFIGIQLGNPSSLASRNSIVGNVIVTDKISGTGIIVYQDTAFIKNNIFWRNKDGIILNRSLHCEIMYNSFYDNGYLANGTCILVNSGSSHPQIEYNTFTGNGNLLINLFEPTGPVIVNNNFFRNRRSSGVVRNNTSSLIAVVNNYWGTTDTTVVGQLASGNFTFTPFLAEPDTVAPISPPQPAFKQVVNNKVRVLWQPNPEADLGGYRVHYGGFKNYQFANDVDAGMENGIILETAGIFDTVAVTAYDSEATRNSWQRLGHESPFSFPVIIPYAGPDTSICRDQAEYFITQSTYLGVYQTLNWNTAGDGIFNSPGQLWTIYYPGQQDLADGSVVLTLQVVSDFVIYEDSFTLSFLDFPFAFAGNDTILAADSSLYLHQALANHYDTLYWTSSGNGIFSDVSILNPVYTPGESDIVNGSVQLIFYAQSACGLATDTLNISIERRYKLEGRVWKDNVLLGNGVVIASRAGENSIHAEKFTALDENGVFTFNGLVTGNYLLYAVPDTALYPQTLPSYYVNKSHWEDAYLLPLTANTYDLDIRLQTRNYMLPQGIGRISGHFITPPEGILEEDIFCADWFNAHGTEVANCNDGVSNVTILLYSKSGTILLDHTLTDAAGNFSFAGLPFGDYLVDAEKAGYKTNRSPLLTLSSQNPEITDIIITLEPHWINILSNSSRKVSGKTEVFPNPAGSTINLVIDSTAEDYFIVEIFNVYNQRILQKQISGGVVSGQEVLIFDVNQLKAGVYFGTITTPTYLKSFSFMKN